MKRCDAISAGQLGMDGECVFGCCYEIGRGSARHVVYVKRVYEFVDVLVIVRAEYVPNCFTKRDRINVGLVQNNHGWFPFSCNTGRRGCPELS